MTKINESVDRLVAIGMKVTDALELRRIAMTLHRWHELECGDSNDVSSWSAVRGHKAKDRTFTYDDDGDAYLECHWHRDGSTTYSRMIDRERGALKRLAKIVARYPGLSAYVQGDPRGAPLYILKPGDVPADEDVSAYYSRGVAVYK